MVVAKDSVRMRDVYGGHAAAPGGTSFGTHERPKEYATWLDLFFGVLSGLSELDRTHVVCGFP